jgi:hypothetical protein
MQTFNDKTAPHQLPFEAFGTEVRICTNSPELLERIELILPPGWRRRPRSLDQDRLGLLDEGEDMYSVYRSDGACVHDAPGMEYALSMLDVTLQTHIALEAKDFVFVHAGVVAHGGRAIVIPGTSFSGKTTLVRALVAAGAVYYSDEFAVLDDSGSVVPYSRPLSIRNGLEGADAHHVEQLGGVAGVEPLPLGLVIATHFRPGAKWQPRPLSPGAGALFVLEHAVTTEVRPEQTLKVLKTALQDSTILQAERGEADEVAAVLLETLRAVA